MFVFDYIYKFTIFLIVIQSFFFFFFLPPLGDGLWVLGVYDFFFLPPASSLFKSRDCINFSYNFYSSYILSCSFCSSNCLVISSYFYSNSSSSYNMYGCCTNSNRVTLFVGSLNIIDFITSLPSYVIGTFLGNFRLSLRIYRTNSFSLSWMNGKVP